MKQDKTQQEISFLLQRICIGFILILIVPILFFIFEPTINIYFQSVKSNIETESKFGDWFGGVIGTIISGITLIVVYITFISQRKELKVTQNQLQTQQFETVFFKMLDTIYTIGRDIQKEGFDGIGSGNEYRYDDFFIGFIRHMDYYYKNSEQNDNFVSLVNQSVRKISEENENVFRHPENPHGLVPNISVVFREWREQDNKNEEIFLGYLYYYLFIEQSDSKLGHFFRYLYNSIKYIESEIQDHNTRKTYVNLIQSQLSNYQLIVLFYSCFSRVSYNSKGEPEVKELLDKYEFFQNLLPRYFLDVKHKELYPTTRPKFKEPYGDDSKEVFWFDM
jgi:hypothetical protein